MPGRVIVYNEHSFIDLSHYDIQWKLDAEGQTMLCGSMKLPSVAPRQRVEVDLDVPESVLSACAGCDLYLTVWYILNQADGVLPAGTVVAYDQIMLAETPQEIETDLSGVPEVAYNADGDLLLSGLYDDGRRLYEWEAVFSASEGELVSYTVAGRELVESALEPCFVRALTENDIGAKLGEKQEFWRTLELECDSFLVTQDEEKCIVEVTYEPVEDKVLVGCIYHIYADGRIDGVMELLDAGGLKQAPMIPRVGMRMAMPGEYSTVEYYGLGPFENYADRSSGALVGEYSHPVEDMYHYGYVRPQESGNRTGLKWAKVINDDGFGLMVTSDRKFSASALPFSFEELDVEMFGNPQYHSLELKSRAYENERSLGETWLHFDLCQMGLGCIDSWGALPREEYRIPAQDYEFTFTLLPLFD
jgi:beta-galactosidase